MNVDIWSDIACPWCYIGKRRFETALAAFPHRDEVTVTWHSYQLDPTLPEHYDGTEIDYLATRKGMAERQGRARGRARQGPGRRGRAWPTTSTTWWCKQLPATSCCTSPRPAARRRGQGGPAARRTSSTARTPGRVRCSSASAPRPASTRPTSPRPRLTPLPRRGQRGHRRRALTRHPGRALLRPRQQVRRLGRATRRGLRSGPRAGVARGQPARHGQPQQRRRRRWRLRPRRLRHLTATAAGAVRASVGERRRGPARLRAAVRSRVCPSRRGRSGSGHPATGSRHLPGEAGRRREDGGMSEHGHDHRYACVSRVPLFADLSDADRHDVADLAMTRHYQPRRAGAPAR